MRTFISFSRLWLVAVFLTAVPLASSQYTSPSYPFHVNLLENMPVGTLVAQVTDTLPNTNSQIVNVVYLGTDDAFYTSKVAGQHRWSLLLNRSLDYETQNSVRVRVQAQGSSPVGYTTFTMTLHVQDVNDNHPQFQNLPYNAEVDEDAIIGATVYTNISAIDRDTGAGGTVKYEIVATSASRVSKFLMDSSSGTVTLNGSLDYESKTFYHYRVVAKDQGIPPLSSTTDLFISVKDVQDNPPLFVNIPYVATVPELIAVGHSVLTVKAVDQDRAIPNPVSYTIVHSTCPGKFRVDAMSGLISVTGALDRDTGLLKVNGRCTIRLRATEQNGSHRQRGNFTTEASATISVTDINDNPPHFSGHSFSANLRENSPPGTPLQLDPGQQIHVTDIDQGSNSAIELFLETVSNTFELVTSTIQSRGSVQLLVKNNTRLDYERQHSLLVKIRATDSGAGHSPATATVTVNILNMNEFSPQFTMTEYTASVPEGSSPQTSVITVRATDRDDGHFGAITYTLSNAQGLFAIDRDSGEVTVTSSQTDREREDHYYMLVVATDGGGLQQTAPLTVIISDVNDNPPFFLRQQFEVTLDKRNANFSHSVTVQATDADEDGTENSNVTYRIISTSPGGLAGHFHLDPLTGQLSVTQALDYDTLHIPSSSAGLVNLVVLASDNGIPRLSTTATVVITLSDLNDTTPSSQNSSCITDATGGMPTGASSTKWTEDLPDGSLKYACAGDTVTLPWNYSLAAGESLEDVQWFYEGMSSQLIAVLTRGVFLPLPAFSQRVSWVSSAGISLLHLTTADSGNYSVEISGRGSSGNFFKYRRSVFLQIDAGLLTTDGKLHVYENPRAIMDSVSNQWSVELSCGNFTYLGHPPFEVQWISPSGSVQNSSTFEDGHFKLYLSMPMEGGSYTCRIPEHSMHTACLPENQGHKGQATYQLDQMASRLTLLEAQQNALHKENNALKVENSALKISESDLTARVHNLEAKIGYRVGFHAYNLRKTQAQHGAPLIVDNVVLNQGQAYNGTTGMFNAPFNGTYFFIGTSGPWATGQNGQFSLTVDGTDISSVSIRDQGPVQTASAQGVVHLTQGQKVWLKASSGIELSSAATSFSGFLVSPDL